MSKTMTDAYIHRMIMNPLRRRTIFGAAIAGIIFIGLLAAPWATAQMTDVLSAELRHGIDRAARQVLDTTGVPSVSIAIVKGGHIAYLQSYGAARLEPSVPARKEMCYGIGSISKQFTATAILMLAEQGKLSLDDPVARFLPTLTRAKEITIRQVLSHTSGYQDYWPQDYMPSFMLQPITAAQILDRWACKPLDFEPGAEWQYSNTGYVVAGLIVERASGQPLIEFLRQQIFVPLGMKNVVNLDELPPGDSAATGYFRYGLGPLRLAPKEGKGWMFAAGDLAMTAEDLAKWDIGLITRKLMKPASYQIMETVVLLRNGLPTGYGLGVQVRNEFSRRALSHGGEVSGFTAYNLVFPDDQSAVAVLANEDASDASALLSRTIARLLFPQEDAREAERLAGKILEGLQKGKIDRSLLSDNANAYFTEQALKDFSAGLGPLGSLKTVTQNSRQERGGMTFRQFYVEFPTKNVRIWQRTLPNGKIEQYQLMAAD